MARFPRDLAIFFTLGANQAGFQALVSAAVTV